MNKKGFTLIELLVTAAIFSVVTGGGVASYVQFNQREKLKATALEIKTYLRKAQTNALAGAKDCSAASAPTPGCGGANDTCGDAADEPTLDGWCLDLYRGYLYGHCGGPVGTIPAPVDFSVESFELPDDVDITFDPPDYQGGILMFKPLGQGVDKNMTICLSTSGFGVSSRYKLSVTTSGEINDEGFVGSCP